MKLVGSNGHLKAIFDYTGALGSFSNRINMAYSLGFITKDEFNDLHTIRKIRNKFGHSYLTLHFDNENIRPLVEDLKFVMRENVYEPRKKFVTCCHYLIGIIIGLKFDRKLDFEERSIDTIEIDKRKNSIKKIIELFEK